MATRYILTWTGRDANKLYVSVATFRVAQHALRGVVISHADTAFGLDFTQSLLPTTSSPRKSGTCARAQRRLRSVRMGPLTATRGVKCPQGQRVQGVRQAGGRRVSNRASSELDLRIDLLIYFCASLSVGGDLKQQQGQDGQVQAQGMGSQGEVEKRFALRGEQLAFRRLEVYCAHRSFKQFVGEAGMYVTLSCSIGD